MSIDITEVFKVLAKYNKLTNQQMIKVLEKVDPKKLTENLGSYYGSILGLLNHSMMADIDWMRTLGTHLSSLSFIPSLLERYSSAPSPPDQLHWKTLDEYKTVRAEVDELLERLVNSINPSQFKEVLKLERRHGTFEFITWHIILHLFNHETHHRGGVAVMLDQLKVENDYSSLIGKV